MNEAKEKIRSYGEQGRFLLERPCFLLGCIPVVTAGRCEIRKNRYNFPCSLEGGHNQRCEVSLC